MLSAEQEPFPAELDLARIRAALLNSVTNIYNETGGGWIATASELAPQPEQGGWLSPPLTESTN